MKIVLYLFAAALISFGCSSCLYKEPVFTNGFAPLDPAIAGIWITEGENGDPREREFAAVVPIGADAYLLHYPVARKGGSYFEAKPLKIRDHDVLQIRLAASFDDGLPGRDTPTYTIAWLQKSADGKMVVRSLKNEGPHTGSAADVRKALEDKGTNWDSLFGDAQTFTRLPEK